MSAEFQYDIRFLLLTFDVFSITFTIALQLHGECQFTVGSEGDQPGQFNYPCGLALTPDENFLLVVDSNNCRVAVLRATDGLWVRQLTGPPGTLLNPCGVAVIPSTGQILVSDCDLHRVIRFLSIDNDSVVGTLGTGRGNGPTEFCKPRTFAVLDGHHRHSVRFSPVPCLRGRRLSFDGPSFNS
jgi:DNA-binding beta-propeller fold protein YncE